MTCRSSAFLERSTTKPGTSRDFECLRIAYRSGGLRIVGFIYKPTHTTGRKLPAIIFNRGGTADFGAIEPEELWNGVRDRYASAQHKWKSGEEGRRFNQFRRPKYLFSRLTKCGECGAGFIIYSREQLGCFGARARGTCTNMLTIPRHEVEERVLRGLQEKLMRKDFFEEFCREFAREINRLRMEQRAGRTSAKRELARIEARRKKLVESIMEGVPASEVKNELIAIADRRGELEAQLNFAQEPPPLLHPTMADLYRSKVEELASALQHEDTRLQASEMLRGLIDAIVLIPDEGQLLIELRGNLAAMLTAAQKTTRSLETGDLFVPVQLVAGGI